MKSDTKKKPNQKQPLIITEYRYNIKSRLAELMPHKKNQVMAYVLKESGFTLRAIYLLINETKSTNKHNNVRVLNAFSEKFNCSINDLFNK